MKRLIAALVSVGLIGFLLWKADTAALLENFRRTRWDLFSAAIALFVPQILTIAWRWKRLVAPFTALPLAESVRMVLAGSTLNLVLPGKLGDLTKGWFLASDGNISVKLGMGVVVFEKMLDLAAIAAFMLGGVLLLLVETAGAGSPADALPISWISLLVACLLGLLGISLVAVLYVIPLNRLPGASKLLSLANPAKDHATVDRSADEVTPGSSRPGPHPILLKISSLLQSSHNTTEALRARGSGRGEVVLLTALIWVLHMLQIYLFFACLGAAPSFGEFFAMVPLAIFIGLIPVSIAGFGTRDAALVGLLPMLPASTVLATALYINLRYILPAIAGLPFLPKYAARRKQSAPGRNR